MHELYNGLNESNSKRIDEAHVGVFYYIHGDVYADSSSIRNADQYGGFVNYGSHYDFWEDELTDYILPGERSHDYAYYPRGRVVFSQELHKYILYIDEILANPPIIQKIADEFGLSNGSFYVDTDDEHYRHYQPDSEVS